MSVSLHSALVLSPEAPYPISGGGALRSASILHYLARLGPLDLILFRQPGAPDPLRNLPPGLARRVTVIALPVHRRSLAARAARNAARLARRVPPLVDRFAGFEREVSAAIAGTRYSLGIIEHSWCAPYFDLLAPACARMVLDLHNVESRLHQRCAETGHGAAGFAHRVFAQASVELERAWLPRFSDVMVPSGCDARAVNAIAPTARVVVYPNALRAGPPPPRADEEAIVFSGNMEYHPNIAAVRFFRREVWPLLRERWPRLVWRLLGRNPQAVREFTAGDSRIEVTGPVEYAVAELARSRVAVVPLLAGSGTRLKILEAWAAGLPVVSTTIGAEGLPARHGENLLLADAAAPFAEAVSGLLSSPDLRATLGAAGRLLVQTSFTWESAWEKLDFLSLP
jgi:polysaccharide biosynthesis protein PslH